MRQAMQQITSAEFTTWLAYLKYHCLDQEGWEQTALMCSVVANCQGAKTNPRDFLPVETLEQREQTAGEMVAVMEQMFYGSGDKQVGGEVAS